MIQQRHDEETSQAIARTPSFFHAAADGGDVPGTQRQRPIRQRVGDHRNLPISGDQKRPEAVSLVTECDVLHALRPRLIRRSRALSCQ
jgi:hypothetical protein